MPLRRKKWTERACGSRRTEETRYGGTARRASKRSRGRCGRGRRRHGGCGSGQAAESAERLAAEGNLARSLLGQGKGVEAERVLRTLDEVQTRVLGEKHPDTLKTTAHLATSLSRQGKYAEAERIEREVLGAFTRVLGAEHPHTLTSAGNLALFLSRQGKYAEAEQMQRELLVV